MKFIWKRTFTALYIPEQVLEPDDEPVDLGVLRVVDGLGYVVDEEVVDVVVPVEDLEDWLVPLSNLIVIINNKEWLEVEKMLSRKYISI